MAALSQYISLNDGVSGPLKKMTDAASAAVNRMEHLGRAATSTESALSTMGAPAAAMTRVSVAASGMVAKIEEVIPAAASARGAVEALGSKASGIFGSIKSSIGSLAGMFAGMFAISSLTSTMQQAKDAAAAQAQADLKLTVIMRQRMGANADMVNSIKQLIGEQQSLGVVSRQTQTAGAQQLATFLTQRESLAALIPAMNNLAAQQHGTKTTAEDMVNISNMMGRALQGNVGALTRCGISFDSGQEQILKYGNEAQRAAVMAEVITQNVGNMNAEMGKTGGGQAVQKMNEVTDVLDRVGKGIIGAFNQLKISGGDIQIGAIETIGWAFTGVINTLAWFAQESTTAYNTVKPFFQEIPQFVSDNWGMMEPIIMGVAWALAIYTAVVTAAAIATGGLAVVSGISAVAGDIVAGALMIAESISSIGVVATFTQLAASGMWTAILLPVAIVIATIYFVVAVVNYFAKTSISATGIVVGAFFWLGGMIYNVVAFVWNTFLALVTFLSSAFTHPLNAIYNVFVSIWNGIVEFVGRSINEIIGLINKLPGMNVGYANWGGAISKKAFVSEANDFSSYNMDYTSGNFMKGYDIGAGLGDKVSSMFPKAPENDGADNSPLGTGLPEALNEGSGPAKDTAGNTGRMADKMDDLDTDLKYLREVAEQEIINKYTTAEIKIDMGGVRNTVSSDVDLDGMMSYMGESLFEAMKSGAEKVHP